MAYLYGWDKNTMNHGKSLASLTITGYWRRGVDYCIVHCSCNTRITYKCISDCQETPALHYILYIHLFFSINKLFQVHKSWNPARRNKLQLQMCTILRVLFDERQVELWNSRYKWNRRPFWLINPIIHSNILEEYVTTLLHTRNSILPLHDFIFNVNWTRTRGVLCNIKLIMRNILKNVKVYLEEECTSSNSI